MGNLESKHCKNCWGESTSFCALCSNCLLDYLNIDEVFKDGFINDKKNEVNTLKQERKKSECSFTLGFAIVSSIVSVALLLYAVITNDVDDMFILIIIGSFCLTLWLLFCYFKLMKNKININDYMTLKDVLLLRENDETQIYRIIEFGEKAKEYYDGSLDELTDDDILFLSKKYCIKFDVAKDYIQYCCRILNAMDDIEKIVLFEQGSEDELDDYYYAQNEYVNEASSENICNQYFDEMKFEELYGMGLSKEYSPFKNLILYFKLTMPKVILFKRSVKIEGIINVLVFENDEMVGDGYIYGEFYNNASYKVICKTIKEIKDFDKVDIRFKVISLWFPDELEDLDNEEDEDVNE